MSTRPRHIIVHALLTHARLFRFCPSQLDSYEPEATGVERRREDACFGAARPDFAQDLHRPVRLSLVMLCSPFKLRLTVFCLSPSAATRNCSRPAPCPSTRTIGRAMPRHGELSRPPSPRSSRSSRRRSRLSRSCCSSSTTSCRRLSRSECTISQMSTAAVTGLMFSILPYCSSRCSPDLQASFSGLTYQDLLTTKSGRDIARSVVNAIIHQQIGQQISVSLSRLVARSAGCRG